MKLWKTLAATEGAVLLFIAGIITGAWYDEYIRAQEDSHE